MSADVDIDVAYRIFLTGGKSAEAELKALNQELKAGNITWEQYRQGVQKVNTGLRTVKDSTMVSKRAFEATHPSVMSLGRAMSAFRSVLSATAAAQSLIQLTNIAMNTGYSRLAEQQLSTERAQRAYNDAVREFGEDSPQAKDALADWNVEQAKLKETLEQQKQADIDKIFNMATGIGLVGTSAIQAVKAIPDIKKTFGTIHGGAFLSKLSVNGLLGSMGRIAGVAAGAGVGIAGMTGQFDDLVKSLTGMESNDFNDAMMNRFATIAGFAASGALVGGPAGALAGGAIGAVIALVQSYQELKKVQEEIANLESNSGFKNRFEDIDTPRVKAAKERLANSSVTYGGDDVIITPKAPSATQSTSSSFTYKGLTGDAARRAKAAGFAEGGVINEPTLMLGTRSGGMGIMAESGPEAIVPMGGRNGASVNITNVYVAGSILSERQLYSIVAANQKRELRRHNFRPR